MKLLRHGPKGHEKPAMLDAQGQVRDLSGLIDDLRADMLTPDDNFFRDACAQAQAVNIDNVDPTAAIVYPIILPDRLDIILKLPGQNNLHHASIPHLSVNAIKQVITQLQQDLQRRSTSVSKIKQGSQQLYNWLLQPFETELTQLSRNQLKTLVFVLDGPLRNIPPSLLYDGKQYLIERYAVAVTPSLELFDPLPLPRQQLNVLIAGTSDAPSFQAEGLAPLSNVTIELEGIARQVNQSKQLAEQKFLKTNIQQTINHQAFNIVHIATHGQFSSNPEQTFILDWQSRIQVIDLDTLLRLQNKPEQQPIDLLVLSACETAAGDDRAALGLAGLAIRTGTRSTLATLFQVNDASTAEFMIQFYRQLRNSQLSKAEALRQVQLSFLQHQTDQDQAITELARPYFWAPFILVGNWL